MKIGSKPAQALLAAALFGVSTAAAALDAGDWLVRARIINVNPQDDSSDVFLNGVPVGAATGLGGASSVEVDDSFTLDIDITYMFTKNIGAELLLDLSSEHDVSTRGTLAQIAPGQLISSRVLPPALLLQYHFLPDAKFRPYVGAGLNYTIFFDEKAEGSAATALGATGLELDNSFGWAVQVGADIELNKDWFFNVDLKYIDISTDASFVSNNVGGAVTTTSVDIDPLVIGVGIGRRF